MTLPVAKNALVTSASLESDVASLKGWPATVRRSPSTTEAMRAPQTRQSPRSRRRMHRFPIRAELGVDRNVDSGQQPGHRHLRRDRGEGHARAVLQSFSARCRCSAMAAASSTSRRVSRGMRRRKSCITRLGARSTYPAARPRLPHGDRGITVNNVSPGDSSSTVTMV
jgi:hypothetical protein